MKRILRLTDRCCDRTLRGSNALDHLGLCQDFDHLFSKTLLDSVWRENLGDLYQFLHMSRLSQTLRSSSALNRLGLWGFGNFLNALQLWDFGCLLQDLHLWNLHDKIINHLVNDLQLCSLYGLLNSLVNGDLSLRQNLAV